jgi:hypothetical protein
MPRASHGSGSATTTTARGETRGCDQLHTMVPILVQSQKLKSTPDSGLLDPVNHPRYDLADLATFLEARAFATWDRIVEGDATDVPPYEDGITSDLVSAIRSSFDPARSYAERYPNRTEGGPRSPNADWEWWLESGGEWLGLRFQAKRIEFSARHYASPDALQAVRLVENRFWPGADENGRERPVYRYPLFCLYTAWGDAAPTGLSEAFRRAFGYSIVPGPIMLKALLAGRAQLDALGQHLFPLAWLFAGAKTPFDLHEELHARFGAEGPGDTASRVYRAPVDAGNTPGDRKKALEDFRRDDERRDAALDLNRVLPPEGEDLLSSAALPPYVQAAAARADWDLARGVSDEDFYARAPADLAFLLLTRGPLG